jgi:hypothetical protein
LLFYTQLGYYGQFLLLQWQIKAAAREAWIAALPDAALTRISPADIDSHGKWEEDGRECWLNDHLYDVIRRKTIDGKIWLFCLDDENEEHLIRRSGEFAHTGNAQPDKRTTHLLSIRIGEAVFDTITLRIGRPYRFRMAWCGPPANPLPTRYTEITVPPPKA